MDIKNLSELYNLLRPAFLVKIRLLKNKKIDYIKIEDIWNYLKENTWNRSSNLCLCEMVNDIIHTDNSVLDLYLKDKLAKDRLYFK